MGVLPFQFGHPWYWILELYHSTAAYYHETSVNAFNLMALIGGLRKPDTDTIAGLSYFSLGMGLLVPLYAFIGWRLWNERSPRGMMFAIFAAVFGFFMLAPRMHERYLYAGLVFAAPLAVEGAEMATVFAILTATCLFNLAYVLHVLDTTVFLDSRDGLAMFASAINVVAFALAMDYGLGLAEGAGPLWRRLASLGSRLDDGAAGCPPRDARFEATPPRSSAHPSRSSRFHGCAPTRSCWRRWSPPPPRPGFGISAIRRRSSSTKFTSWRRRATTSAPSRSSTRIRRSPSW